MSGRHLAAALSALLGLLLLAATALPLGVTALGVRGSTAGAPACASAPVLGVDARSAAALSPLQLANAAGIIAAGRARGVPPRGQVIAVAVAEEESGLRALANTGVPESLALPHQGLGQDHTSVGLFQQLDSWGSAAQRLDTDWSAGAFYAHLLAVPGWQGLPLTVAAQAVQRSAFPGAYAPYEPVATQLVLGASAAGTVVSAACDVGPGGAGAPVTATGAVAAALAFARSKLGLPYLWGGAGPLYDCSGLVQAAYAAAGIALPRTTAEQVGVGAPVAEADLAPGDLVFPDPGHVQIYVGGGQVIEAPHTGALVRLVPVWGFWQARRVVTA